MPTTPTAIFKQIGLKVKGQVKWNNSIPINMCGLYVIALTDNADSLVCNKTPSFCDIAFDNWLKTINSGSKQILIDNIPANRESLKQRLLEFWLPDETIIYIGKAGPTKNRTLRKRVNEYYMTKLCCDKKHAGGHWINVLQNINELTVFFSDYSENDIDEMEEKMLSYFIDNVTETTKNCLHDKINCFPFANKVIHKKAIRSKITKKHGLDNQTIDCGNQWKKKKNGL